MAKPRLLLQRRGSPKRASNFEYGQYFQALDCYMRSIRTYLSLTRAFLEVVD